MTTPPNTAQPDALGGTRMQPPPETLQVPLRFGGHNFDAHCYNAIGCRVIYDNHDFSPWADQDDSDTLVSPAPGDPANYREDWGRALYIVMRNFPKPAQVRWKSLDGEQHEAAIDFSAIFKDELIWHKVPKHDMAHFFEGPYAGDPSIYLEVNDRTINVYTKMFIPTKSEQTPGNKDSNYRVDLFLVWTRIY